MKEEDVNIRLNEYQKVIDSLHESDIRIRHVIEQVKEVTESLREHRRMMDAREAGKDGN